MVNYTYVRLSSDIHSDSDITRSSSDIQSLLIQYPFGYFATSVRISVRISVRVYRIGFGCGFGYRVKCPPLILTEFNSEVMSVCVCLLYPIVQLMRLLQTITMNLEKQEMRRSELYPHLLTHLLISILTRGGRSG